MGGRFRFDPRDAGLVILAGVLLGIGFDVVVDGFSRWSQVEQRPVLGKKEAAALLARRNRERLGSGGPPCCDAPVESAYAPKRAAVPADEDASGVVVAPAADAAIDSGVANGM